MNLRKGLLFLTTALLFGCEEQLELTNPNRPTTESFWQTSDEAIRGLSSAYAAFTQDGTYMRFFPMAVDIRADDYKGDSPWIDIVQISTFNVPATSAPLIWMWSNHYQAIWRANQVLTYVPDIEMEEDLKQRVLGQAYFLRGLAFFNMRMMFKSIPLITTLQEPENYNVSQASDEEIWAQIYSDFQMAKDRLPVTYANLTGPDQGQAGRATKGAAAGFLGKAYLYNQEWQRAADEFAEIIGYGVYQLVPNYRDNFTYLNENNVESIFEIQFSRETGGGIDLGWQGEPAPTWGQTSAQAITYGADGYGFSDVLPTTWIYQEYQQERTTDDQLDPRASASIAFYNPASGDTTIYGNPWLGRAGTTIPALAPGAIYPRKFTNDGMPDYLGGNEYDWRSGINYRLMRYADVLLMYAEALNELGRTADAYPLIQQVRDRAHLPDLATTQPGLGQQAMREQLAHERALEFALEGLRYYDILRWGWLYDADKLAMLRAHDPEFNNWVPGKEFLPIPQSELNANPNLNQNPSY
ncbi:Starch-binding associating with outer membrane [Catalinimonas alkaloidigena]|uniref:Starch-binding associating with outer membrane n=1 Tax=Catalinimonas alkaloidigena TaxID=1075417 RepID=A0A1G9S7K2_9BACT|nr:RagB/SusD family nutrient uptake outer membrane protein [Catalinimonas alkaloidigena]SDM31277.1 Starch-binding associating with outer membrane [Catalinimonas alkaloidigena]